MIKKEKYVVTHINSDVAPDKGETSTAGDILNMEVVNNGSIMSLSPIRDKSLFSEGYAYTILGRVELGTFLYLIVKKDSSTHVLKVSSLGIITDLTPFGMTVNYSTGVILDMTAIKENETISRLYWCGGGEQLCVISTGVVQTSVYDPRIAKPFTVVRPQVFDTLSGGALKAGVIQYACTQFQLNGSETTISLLSPLSPVSIGGKGGKSGDTMNISKEVIINLPVGSSDVFPYIRIFSIHYQELNQLPKITLIYEEKVFSNTIKFIDDGNSFIAEYSPEEFLFLGGKLISPKTLSQKNNRLFLANYTNTAFEVPFNASTDCRTFGFAAGGGAANVYMSDGSGVVSVNSTFTTMPSETHDCVNTLKDTYKYQKDGVTPGASGPLFDIGFVTATQISTTESNFKSLKQGETYRVGFVFYDKFMRTSSAYWSIDIKIPRYSYYPIIGLNIKFVGNASLLKGAFGVYGWSTVIVQRLERDRTVSSQGILVPSCEWVEVSSPAFPYYTPTHVTKRITYAGTTTPGANIFAYYSEGIDWPSLSVTRKTTPSVSTILANFYSGDTILQESGSPYTSVYTARVAKGTTLNSQTKFTYWKDGGIVHTRISSGLRFEDFSASYAGFVDSNLQFMRPIRNTYDGISQYDIQYKLNTILQNAASNEEVPIVESKFIPRNSSGIVGDYTIANFVDLPDYAGGTDNTVISNYRAEMANSYAIQFTSPDWHKLGGLSWGKFINFNSIPNVDEWYYPIVELLRNIPNQYGGNSYASKHRNIYMRNGAYVSIEATSVVANFIGDVTIGPLAINRQDGLDTKLDNYWNVYEYIYLNQIENNVDVYSRTDLMAKWKSGLDDTVYGTYRLDDNHELLGAYNQENLLNPAFPLPSTFNAVQTFSESIIASKVKIPNETIDSWQSFLPNETLTLQGTYGSITKLYSFMNEIYAFQERAISQILIQPKVQIQTSVESGVELGTGQILYNYTYLNTLSGTIAIWSIVDDSNLLFYYDHVTNTINSINGEEISKGKFVQNLMETYKPSNPYRVMSLYSSRRGEFYFTLSGCLLVYNTTLQQFQRRESMDSSSIFMSFMGMVISSNNSEYLEVAHSSDIKKTGMITYYMAPNPETDKVFHNIEYRSRGNLEFTSISVKTAGGLSGVLSPVPLATRVKTYEKFRIKRVHLPRIVNSRDRVRDTHISVTITIKDLTTDYSRSYLDDLFLMYNIKG